MLQTSDHLRFSFDGDFEDFEGDAAVEITVARGIDDSEASAADLALELVAGSGEIGQGDDAAEMIDDGVAYFHRRRNSW